MRRDFIQAAFRLVEGQEDEEGAGLCGAGAPPAPTMSCPSAAAALLGAVGWRGLTAVLGVNLHLTGLSSLFPRADATVLVILGQTFVKMSAVHVPMAEGSTLGPFRRMGFNR